MLTAGAAKPGLARSGTPNACPLRSAVRSTPDATQSSSAPLPPRATVLAPQPVLHRRACASQRRSSCVGAAWVRV